MAFGGSGFGGSSGSGLFANSSSSFGGSSIFGTHSPAQQQARSGFSNSGLFGQSSSATSTPLFGKPQGTGLFSSASGGGFGPGTGASGAFGSTTGFGSGGFGSAQSSSGLWGPGSGSGTFGVTNNPPRGPAGAFGSTGTGFGSTNTSGGFVGFGSGSGGTGFGQQQQQTGTRGVSWVYTTMPDGNNNEKYVSISAIPQFREKSLEELRLEDYANNDFGNTATPGGTSIFGSGSGSTQPRDGGLFANPKPPLLGGGGGSGGFGQSSGGGLFGNQQQQQVNPFGGNQQQQMPQVNPFGGGNLGSTASSAGTGLFGSASTPAFGSTNPSPFGGSGAAQSTPSLFGGSGGGQSGGLFGNTQSSSGFGGNPPGTGLFGAKPTFGAAAAGGIFGSGGGATQSVSTLFGSSAPAFGSSAFGGGASSTQSAPSLFGATGNTGTGLFSSTPSTGGGLFGSSTSSSAFGGSGLFGAKPSTGFGAFGSGTAGSGSGLFGSTGNSLFGNTQSAFGGGSTFGSGPGGFGFGSTFGGAPQAGATQNTSEGPLYASVSINPFGSSKLFEGAIAALQRSSGNAKSAPEPLKLPAGDATSGKTVSVVVGRPRVRPPSHPIAHAVDGRALELSTNFSDEMTRRGLGAGLFGPKTETRSGLFHAGTSARRAASRSRFLDSAKRMPLHQQQQQKSLNSMWRTPQQLSKCANIKRLVIHPVENANDDPAGPIGAANPNSTAIVTAPAPTTAASNAEQKQGSGVLKSNLRTPGTTARVRNSLRFEKGTPFRTRDKEAPSQENIEDEITPVVAPSSTANGLTQKERPARPPPLSTQAKPSDTDKVNSPTNDPFQSVRKSPGSPKRRASGTSGSESPTKKPTIPNGADHVVKNTAVKLANESPAKPKHEDPPKLLASYGDFFRSSQLTSPRRQRTPERNGKGATPPFTARKDVYTRPSLYELSKLDANAMQEVDDFCVGRIGVGEVQWPGKTDVTGLDIDYAVDLRYREIRMYEEAPEMPPRGTALNKTAIIKLRGIWKRDPKTKQILKGNSDIKAMERKLKSHCEKEGLKFLYYEATDGTWCFRTEGF